MFSSCSASRRELREPKDMLLSCAALKRGRILVGLRWWNEIDDNGESVWKFECLDQEVVIGSDEQEGLVAVLVDSLLDYELQTLAFEAVVWIFFGIFSLIRFQADYLLVVGVCLTLSIANIVGFTKCRKDAKKQIQQFASQTIANRFQSTIQSAFSVV
ncbi:Golgi apparatus membrane protein-like protein ECHIDNA [Tanacetum coccineum]